MDNLLYEKIDEIGIITMNRPKSLNALNAATLQELDTILADIATDFLRR